MNKSSLMALAAMGAIAASGSYKVRGDRRFDMPSSPRLRHARKVHPRNDAHMVGAWRDPGFNPADAARRNMEMEIERAEHKAKRLEDGRANVASGLKRVRG